MDDQFDVVFEQALTALEAGESVDAILARYPTQAAELRPLLEGAQAAQMLAPTTPPPSPAQAASRAKLIYQAGELRNVPPQPPPFFSVAYFARMALAMAIMISGLSVAVASAQSLPGDVLYPVKRSLEDMRLWLALDTRVRRQLETDYAKRRTEEVRALTTQGRTATVEFTGVVEEMHNDYWLVDGITISVMTLPTMVISPTIGSVVEVAGNAQGDGHVLATRVTVENIGEIVTPVPLPTVTVVLPTLAPPTMLSITETPALPLETSTPANSDVPPATATPVLSVSPLPVTTLIPVLPTP